MRLPQALVSLLVLVLPLLSAAPLSADDAVARTPLTSIGLVSDIDAAPDADDPGVGGGFDTASYFENLVDIDVASCTAKINQVVDDWITANGLGITLNEIGPANLLVHAGKRGETGFFEVSYRFNASQKRARVTLFYVGGEGRLHDAAGIKELLDAYAVEKFQDALRDAIVCRSA